MKLPLDLFGWLGIPAKFALDMAELDRRQRELYVERQADGPRSLELLNEVVRQLRDPAVRAEQIFRRRGWRTKGSPDPILLERIFTDREFIDHARKKGDVQALEAWLEAAKPRHQTLFAELSQLLDNDPRPAEPAYGGWETNGWTVSGSDNGPLSDGSANEGSMGAAARSNRRSPNPPESIRAATVGDGCTDASDAEAVRLAERALLLLEELRYFSRALGAAHAAIAAIEE